MLSNEITLTKLKKLTWEDFERERESQRERGPVAKNEEEIRTSSKVFCINSYKKGLLKRV